MSEQIALKRLVGENIRSLRKTRGWTQEKLGEVSGLSYKFLGEVERGTVNPSLDSLEVIAQAFDVEVAKLLLREGLIIMSDSDAVDARTALASLIKVIGKPDCRN